MRSARQSPEDRDRLWLDDVQERVRLLGDLPDDIYYSQMWWIIVEMFETEVPGSTACLYAKTGTKPQPLNPDLERAAAIVSMRIERAKGGRFH
jgi:hypothetical protein